MKNSNRVLEMSNATETLELHLGAKLKVDSAMELSLKAMESYIQAYYINQNLDELKAKL